jgi:hypothetical protein
MRLCLTLLVRNEENIISHNIEYHLNQGVDFIIATDNLSEDSTPDILREYEKKGVLHYISEKNDDYSQDLWVTRMAKIAAKQYEADWVIHTDADEFWWPNNNEDLKTTLSNIPPNIDGLYINRVNFITPKKYRMETPFYNQLIMRHTVSLNSAGKPLPGKICHRAAEDVYIGQGNHIFSFPEREPNILNDESIVIFHFPYRGKDEFKKKIMLGGAAYENNTRLHPALGYTWRELYKLGDDKTLSDFYENITVTDKQLDKMIKNNEAVFDDRLRNYISNMYRKK